MAHISLARYIYYTEVIYFLTLTLASHSQGTAYICHLKRLPSPCPMGSDLKGVMTGALKMIFVKIGPQLTSLF